MGTFEINVGDTLSVSDAFVGHKRGTDGSEAICTGDGVQSASADYSPGSAPSFTLAGQNRHEEQGALGACSVRLARLACDGQPYSRVESGRGRGWGRLRR